jgi:hypothetical protein
MDIVIVTSFSPEGEFIETRVKIQSNFTQGVSQYAK